MGIQNGRSAATPAPWSFITWGFRTVGRTHGPPTADVSGDSSRGDSRTHLEARNLSVEAELVPFGISHHDEAGAHRRNGLLATQSSRSGIDEPLTLSLERCHSLFTAHSRSRTDVEVDTILGHLALRHLLEEDPRSMSIRVLDGRSRVALSLWYTESRKEIVPSGERVSVDRERRR